jgi:hypothetical protein
MAGERPIVLLPAANMRPRVLARLKDPANDTSGQVVPSKMPDLRNITTAIHWLRTWSNFETDLAYFELARAIWPQEQLYAKLLAWKPPWFVQVDPAEQFPHFVRTREISCGVSGGTGVPPVSSSACSEHAQGEETHGRDAHATRYLGPFPGGNSADKFIQIIADVFDLCRDYKMLRQAPGGRPCAWAQIGKCLGPCHGKITLDEYRRVIAQAADFAAGRRDELKAMLQARMKDAAGRLAFEEASAIKHRLARMEELSGHDYCFVRDVSEFRYILIHSGPTRRKARVFVVAQLAEIGHVADLDYPPKLGQLEQLLGSFGGTGVPPVSSSAYSARNLPEETHGQDAHATEPHGRDAHATGSVGRWRMGLVAHYLFSSPQRSGVVIHYDASLTTDEVAHRLEEGHEVLRLLKPKPKG